MTTTTTTTTTKNKRKRNAGRRIVFCPHASGVRDAPRSKAACAALRLRARSPAGVPLRFSPAGLSSRRLSVGPGFPKKARKLRRAARTVSGHSDAPRAPVVLPAGMMPEPPGCGVYRSARGRRTSSAFREDPPPRPPLERDSPSIIPKTGTHVNGKVTPLVPEQKQKLSPYL